MEKMCITKMRTGSTLDGPSGRPRVKRSKRTRKPAFHKGHRYTSGGDIFADIPDNVMFMVRQTPMNARTEDGHVRILVRGGHNDRIVISNKMRRKSGRHEPANAEKNMWWESLSTQT